MSLKPLLFVHIPKTAGSTLHSILTQQYRRDRTLVTTDPRDPLMIGSKGGNFPFELIIGHCPVGTHEVLPNLRYASCVRDPARRIISHYYFAKNDPTHYLHETVRSKAISLQDYVESGFSSELSNGMVRMLSGAGAKEPSIDRALFEQALAVIEKYFVTIAVTERFDESALVLQQLLGLATPYYRSKKVGKYPSRQETEVTKEVCEVIRARNPFDYQLYDHVNQNLDKQVTQLRITVQKVERFSRKNKSFGAGLVYLREGMARLFGGRKVAGTPFR